MNSTKRKFGMIVLHGPGAGIAATGGPASVSSSRFHLITRSLIETNHWLQSLGRVRNAECSPKRWQFCLSTSCGSSVSLQGT